MQRSCPWTADPTIGMDIRKLAIEKHKSLGEVRWALKSSCAPQGIGGECRGGMPHMAGTIAL